ncbi:MAG: hypothetical protein ACTSPB_11200 [Candidatus Thorarchaeota archaeon]
MSAGDWTDCPTCGKKQCVNIRVAYDSISQKTDSIIHDIQGTCMECGTVFEIEPKEK